MRVAESDEGETGVAAVAGRRGQPQGPAMMDDRLVVPLEAAAGVAEAVQRPRLAPGVAEPREHLARGGEEPGGLLEPPLALAGVAESGEGVADAAVVAEDAGGGEAGAQRLDPVRPRAAEEEERPEGEREPPGDVVVALVRGDPGGGDQVEPLGLAPAAGLPGGGEGERAARLVRQRQGRGDALRAEQAARVVGGAEVPGEDAAEGGGALLAGRSVAEGPDAVAALGALLQLEAAEQRGGLRVGDGEQGGRGRDGDLAARVQGEEPRDAARRRRACPAAGSSRASGSP
ncbi:hypothetical protein LUX32_18685 [Actinomadura madurae]|nr:hypothetical protein [Actinomadura madurae]MCP9979402.1 hypothetical protein [Actinomadura madurae]